MHRKILTKNKQHTHSSGHAIIIFIIVIFLVIISIVIAQIMLTRFIKTPDTSSAKIQTAVPAAAAAPLTPHITRQLFLEPGRKFYLNTVFMNEEKVAEFKSSGDDIFDLSGTIPNGKVEFKNPHKESQGYEYFQNNIRQGEYKEYHSNGLPWFDKRYKDGRMISVTEYFDNGMIRMKADYSDALETCETKDNGSGAIYRSNGKMMYEWHLTGSDTRRFKKFYDTEGRHQETQYFDVKGRLINEDLKASSAEM